MNERPVLLYDSGCRFCRFVARIVVRLDRHEHIAFLPIQDPQADPLLSDLTEGQRLASIHLVEPEGKRYSRGVALTRLIRHLGMPAPKVLGRAYDPVSRNRGKFGKHVPDGRAPRRYP
jgi:predicted DCC family thiol-disulfide oxidoreductase YuxK